MYFVSDWFLFFVGWFFVMSPVNRQRGHVFFCVCRIYQMPHLCGWRGRRGRQSSQSHAQPRDGNAQGRLGVSAPLLQQLGQVNQFRSERRRVEGQRGVSAHFKMYSVVTAWWHFFVYRFAWHVLLRDDLCSFCVKYVRVMCSSERTCSLGPGVNHGTNWAFCAVCVHEVEWVLCT